VRLLGQVQDEAGGPRLLLDHIFKWVPLPLLVAAGLALLEGFIEAPI
jgi:hypothetical protein